MINKRRVLIVHCATINLQSNVVLLLNIHRVLFYLDITNGYSIFAQDVLLSNDDNDFEYRICGSYRYFNYRV